MGYIIVDANECPTCEEFFIIAPDNPPRAERHAKHGGKAKCICPTCKQVAWLAVELTS